MCETIAKVVVALIIGLNVSLFICQVNTTENVGQNLDPCATQYKDYCMNEGECFSYVEEIFYRLSLSATLRRETL